MRLKSRQKRSQRQHKYKARECSNVGGLFIFGDLFARAQDKAPLDPDQVTDIKLASHLAFANMVGGTSTSDDWGMVAGSMNTALVLAEQGYGAEHEDIFVRAQDALARSYLRGMQTGIWRFDGAGLQDVRIALDLHDQQCDLVTRADIKAALAEVEHRMSTGNTYQIVAA